MKTVEYDEAQTANLLPEGPNSEPTRAILYRSAASLAYQCQEFQVAQRLIAKGLSGYPPPQIEQALKTLYEQVDEALTFAESRHADQEEIEVEGIVDYASSRQGNMIGLTTGDNRQYYLLLEEYIDQWVKSYFNQAVKVVS